MKRPKWFQRSGKKEKAPVHPSSDEEKNALLLQRCTEHLIEKLPQLDLRSPYLTRFHLYGTSYEAALQLKPLHMTDKTAMLVTLVHTPGSDLCLTNIMHSGTAEELRAYLAEKNHRRELLKSLTGLAKAMDERDD